MKFLFSFALFICLFQFGIAQQTFNTSPADSQFIDSVKGTYHLYVDNRRCEIELDLDDLQAINNARMAADTVFIEHNSCITIAVLPEAVINDVNFVREEKIYIKKE